ncbi:MAG: DUF4265 domain-containing protein [Sulfuritalea sp.]|nr:DUF4265 domain-containing protein [Sulfuritalea sp.]
MTDRVKILFEYDSGALGSTEVESMWAIPTIEGFKVDNIPFYAHEISAGDIVSASPDPGGMLRFEALVTPSQHSTVRLWFAKDRESDVPRVRQELRDLGCPSELSDLPRLVAVDIPPTISYDIVRDLLDSYENVGLLEYEESCLGKP